MRICFFGSGIYDSLIGHQPGGAELQISLLAKALADTDHEVFIIENSKNNKPLKINSINILFTATSSLKGFRFITQRIPNMIRFLKNIKPDYIYTRGISQWSLIPLFYSGFSKNCQFILAIPSDIDTFSFWKRFRYVYTVKTSFFNWLKNDLPSSLFYSVLKKQADILLCQHSGQLAKLSEYIKKTYVFTNIFIKSINYSEIIYKRSYFIYVGSLNERKGLPDLVYLIRNLQEIRFKVIGQALGSKSITEVNKLRLLKNVEIIRHLPNNKVISAMGGAKALINVSKYEGFPNTFLEAWALGVPVISLNVNPGNIIVENNLGLYAGGNIETMKDFIENFKDDFAGNNLKEYVIINHAFKDSAKRFMNIINNSEKE